MLASSRSRRRHHHHHHQKITTASSSLAATAARRVIAGPPTPPSLLFFWTFISVSGHLSFLLLPGKVKAFGGTSATAAGGGFGGGIVKPDVVGGGLLRGAGAAEGINRDLAQTVSNLHLCLWIWPLVDLVYRWWMIVAGAPIHAVIYFPRLFLDSSACLSLAGGGGSGGPSTSTRCDGGVDWDDKSDNCSPTGYSAAATADPQQQERRRRVLRTVCGDSIIEGDGRHQQQQHQEDFAVGIFKTLRGVIVGWDDNHPPPRPPQPRDVVDSRRRGDQAVHNTKTDGGGLKLTATTSVGRVDHDEVGGSNDQEEEVVVLGGKITEGGEKKKDDEANLVDSVQHNSMITVRSETNDKNDNDEWTWAEPERLIEILEHMHGSGQALLPPDRRPPQYISARYYTHRQVWCLTGASLFCLWLILHIRLFVQDRRRRNLGLLSSPASDEPTPLSAAGASFADDNETQFTFSAPVVATASSPASCFWTSIHVLVIGPVNSVVNFLSSIPSVSWMCLLSGCYAMMWQLVKAMPLLTGTVYPVAVCVLVALSMAVPSV